MITSDERDKLELVLSELVNNAVVHGGAATAEHQITVHLAVAPERIRAEVCDPGSGFDPDALASRQGQIGGYGLTILDGLTSRWGVSSDDGTCVWFEDDRWLEAE
jgi:anti-sigma regulatory factor (Ser/Thr protein kinase)